MMKTPVLDYPEHSDRHHRHFVAGEWIEAELELPGPEPVEGGPDWWYEPPPGHTAPRTEALINFCIRYRVAVALALWGLILSSGLAVWMWW